MSRQFNKDTVARITLEDGQTVNIYVGLQSVNFLQSTITKGSTGLGIPLPIRRARRLCMASSSQVNRKGETAMKRPR